MDVSVLIDELDDLVRSAKRGPAARPGARGRGEADRHARLDAVDDPRGHHGRRARPGAGDAGERADYADDILDTLEVNLSRFIAAVERGRERLQRRDEPAEGG